MFGALSGALFAVVAVGAWRVRGRATPLAIDHVVTGKLRSPRIGQALTDLRLSGLWDGLAPDTVRYTVPLAAVAAVTIVAGVAWRRRDWAALAVCLAGPPLAVLLTDVIAKPLVGRRLYWNLSYPSGHATGAAAVAAVVLVVCHRWKGWRALVVAAPLALALPAVMGVALVRLNWHYPTDVIGGVAMGAATVLALAAALGAPQNALTRSPQSGPPVVRT